MPDEPSGRTSTPGLTTALGGCPGSMRGLASDLRGDDAPMANIGRDLGINKTSAIPSLGTHVCQSGEARGKAGKNICLPSQTSGVHPSLPPGPPKCSTKSAKPNDKKSIISRGAVGTLGPIMKSGDDTYFDLTPEALLVPLALS